MKVKEWKHENVLPNGKFLSAGGSVEVTPGIKLSQPNGGCSLKGCRCSIGHWISINRGYDAKTKTVSGKTLYFDSHREMVAFAQMFIVYLS
jgi:hypothetical protein